MLARDDRDAAIEAGLMDLVPCPPGCACAGRWTPILDAQRQLRFAWEARDRHRARQVRLARRAAERDARRAPVASAQPTARPPLPPSAAAILARAKARAAGHKATE
nr:hypothetical protein [Pseudoxanthomonas sp.]